MSSLSDCEVVSDHSHAYELREVVQRPIFDMNLEMVNPALIVWRPSMALVSEITLVTSADVLSAYDAFGCAGPPNGITDQSEMDDTAQSERDSYNVDCS